jgi:hypothetical protein
VEYAAAGLGEGENVFEHARARRKARLNKKPEAAEAAAIPSADQGSHRGVAARGAGWMPGQIPIVRMSLEDVQRFMRGFGPPPGTR